jgi:hypothetical protein
MINEPRYFLPVKQFLIDLIRQGLPDGILTYSKFTQNLHVDKFLESFGTENVGIFHCHLTFIWHIGIFYPHMLHFSFFNMLYQGTKATLVCEGEK